MTQFVKGETLSNTVSNTLSNAEVVAKHYNQLEDKGIQQRNSSEILHLRNFNNWTKSVLISKYVYKTNVRNPVALDFCCGKLGDMKKWKIARVNYLVGVDIAYNSLTDAVERFGEESLQFPVNLICADCCAVDLIPHYKGTIFDVCSTQFALHYSFESEEKARTFMRNATSNLKVGGYFFGTIPRACYLLKRGRESNGRFGNSIYNVNFVSDVHSPDLPAFGVKYEFTLKEAINTCPEYLVHPKILQKLGEEYGLQLVELTNFSKFHTDNYNVSDNAKLWDRMRVEPISDEEWEAICLYDVFAFKKVSNQPLTQQYIPHPKRLEKEDILILTK